MELCWGILKEVSKRGMNVDVRKLQTLVAR